VKLLWQMGIAAMVWWAGIRIDHFPNPFTGAYLPLGGWSMVVTVLWLVSFTNLMNLIDGIDGWAGGIGLMLVSHLAIVGLQGQLDFMTLIALGTAGALIGFLCYNFPPAKLYLGDGGAYFLGFLIGTLAIVGSRHGSAPQVLLSSLMVAALPIADVVLVITRRAVNGLPVFRADRKHIHHRLLSVGFTPRQTLMTLSAIAALCFAAGLVMIHLEGKSFLVLVAAILAVLAWFIWRFEIIGDWNSQKTLLSLSGRLRVETRYVLTMARWLELEAGRCPSLHHLWLDFQMILGKLRFSRAILHLPEGKRVWERDDGNAGSARIVQRRYELDHRRGIALEFHAHTSAMSHKLFDQLTELAAESWITALRRLEARTPIVITSDEAPGPVPSPNSVPGLSRVARQAGGRARSQGLHMTGLSQLSDLEADDMMLM
jgi:UDP-GlcNAc:undecaprenyl-phosphate GlcNAc-1-phosphate transferase